MRTIFLTTKGGDSMQTRLISSQKIRERLVSTLLDQGLGSFPCQGWSVMSITDVGGCSPFVLYTNITPFEGGASRVRSGQNVTHSTNRFRFAVISQHQELYDSIPKESINHVLSITIPNSANLFPLQSWGVALIPGGLSRKSHSVETERNVSAVGVPYQKLSE